MTAMTTDNIPRFPYSGYGQRSVSTIDCGLSDAEIATRETKFLADWKTALANAAIAVEQETAAIIAATRKARAVTTAAVCREDQRRQTVTRAAE